jgi:hypothetical protein
MQPFGCVLSSDPLIVWRALSDSIVRLTAGSRVTRQAIARHLHVMKEADLVGSKRRGRESVWQLERERLEYAGGYLDLISKRWDDALGRLREFVEG